MLVEDPAFVANHPPRWNWEYEPSRGSDGPGFVPLADIDSFTSRKWRSPEDVTMPGLAATLLGIDWLRKARGIT